ncbi:MAG TPA: hypothetical protein VEX40_06450, partial [Mycobacterium sp.]|nr:hypothetical protein [Mycobacterium sp.]
KAPHSVRPSGPGLLTAVSVIVIVAPICRQPSCNRLQATIGLGPHPAEVLQGGAHAMTTKSRYLSESIRIFGDSRVLTRSIELCDDSLQSIAGDLRDIVVSSGQSF